MTTRLFGALGALWLLFAVLMMVVMTVMSPTGFTLPIPDRRSVSSVIFSLLFYVPPLVCGAIWSKSYAAKQTNQVLIVLGWMLTGVLGFLVAGLALAAASSFILR